jgi:hypothetical protein
LFGNQASATVFIGYTRAMNVKVNRLFSGVKRFIFRYRTEIFIVLFAAAYFSYMYITEPTRPGSSPNSGWLSYFDQSAYMKQAVATKARNLSDYFVYGPVYPLLAVPFLWLGFYTNALFFFNIFSFVFVTLALFYYVRSVSRQSLGLVAALGLVFATPLAQYTVVPWNSTVCLVSMGILFFVASSKSKTLSYKLVSLLALACGLAFGARYIDVVWVFVASAALLLLRHNSFKKVVILGLMTLALCLPVLGAHYKVFGSPLKTPYVLHTSMNGDGVTDQNLEAYSLKRIPHAAYGMFVSPKLAGSPDLARGLLATSFWLLAAFAFPFAKGISREHRSFLLALLGLAILHSLFYLSFRASGPGAVKFGTLHYFKMFWPALVALSVLTIDSFFSNPTIGSASSTSRKR